MTVWLVIEYDYQDSYIRAAYEAESLAKQHADEMGFGLESVEISSELPCEVTDPDAVKGRREARERDIKAGQQRLERERQQYSRALEITTANFGNPGLCHCETFTNNPLWNAHGYCAYCGGFSPSVFRAVHGEAKLIEHIAKLNEWERNKMNAICFPTNSKQDCR